MVDILLTRDGDLKLNETGDIDITNSVRQAIQIRLRWFRTEWRLGPELGIPYFEEILVKNPVENRIKNIFREALLEVDGVKEVKKINFGKQDHRTYTLEFEVVVTDGSVIKDEVMINV